MKLSANTLNALAQIINGEQPKGETERYSPYRTLGNITDFFGQFGERDLHPRSGAPSRFTYTIEKLSKLNGTDRMAEIVRQALDAIWTEREFNAEHAGAFLNKFLRRDGYEAILLQRYIRMNGDVAETEPYFEIRSLRSTVIEAHSLVNLTEESITEHLVKARAKIDAGDHAGAITNAYTLVEEFLKEILRRTDTPFKADEGDIRELYKAVVEPLNLSPKGETLESYLKTILPGLKSQLSGLYELANKASDRHARRYNPARHHAKLAVNAAFTLCEFLLDSWTYQQERKARKAAS